MLIKKHTMSVLHKIDEQTKERICALFEQLSEGIREKNLKGLINTINNMRMPRAARQFADLSGEEWKMEIASEETLLTFRGVAIIRMYSEYLSVTEADHLYGILNESCPWKIEKVRIAGREIDQARESCLMGEGTYYYSGLKRSTIPVHSALVEFVQTLERRGLIEGARAPNLFLLNRYSPLQHISEHSDDEKDIDQTQSIWSLSLGQERTLVIREKKSKIRQLKGKKRRWKMEIQMPHGTLLEFCPGMQEWFSHEVIKPRGAREISALKQSRFKARINVTARVHSQ